MLGCPHRCVFCNQRTITGVKGNIDIKELDVCFRSAVSTLSDNLDRVEIAFYGGSFSCLPLELQAGLLSLASRYVSRFGFWGVRLSTRPDCLEDKEVLFLKEKGVKTIEIGAQSLNDDVLLLCKRGHTVKDVFESSVRVKNAGLELGIQIMIGLPGDSEESFFHTIRVIVDNIKPSFVRIYPCLVIEGSELAEMYKNGNYMPLSLDKAVELSALAYRRLNSAGINVVRMGLQDVPSMRWNKEILAGPYHPAFGELVKSKIFYDEIVDKISEQHGVKEVFIHFNPRDESIVRGQRNKNLLHLSGKYPHLKISLVRDAGISRGKLLVTTEG